MKNNEEIISQIKIDRATASRELDESIKNNLKDSKIESESELQILIGKVINSQRLGSLASKENDSESNKDASK